VLLDLLVGDATASALTLWIVTMQDLKARIECPTPPDRRPVA
jgi:hypothetical protein